MHSVEAVKAWLKAMGERGVYGGASARIRATAIEQLASVLAKDEPKDVKWLLEHVDEIARRWATKNQANPGTTDTYRSRAKGTLRDYLEYQQDPAKFRPSRNSSSKNPANGRVKKKVPQERTARAPTVASDSAAPEGKSDPSDSLATGTARKDSQSFSFVLSGGRRAHLVVPADLSKMDIRILRKQIELLELQVETGSSTGGED